jgi:hypothetical protein
MNTIIYDNYEFKIEVTGSGTQINITLTDTDLSDIYEAIIKESDIYVKPIKKFYSLIEKGLNKEPNYNVIITNKKGLLVCSFSYNNEIVDIEETITFIKIDTHVTKELLLIKRVKELEDMLTPIFGFNKDTGEQIKFDLNSTVLDFRPFNIDVDRQDKYKYFDTTNISEFNKFKNVKKIIFDSSLSPIYTIDCCKGLSIGKSSERIIFAGVNCILMPSVIEIVEYISKAPLINGLPSHLHCQSMDAFGYTRSFPNLKKISIIGNGGLQAIHFDGLMNLHDTKAHGKNPPLPKLNHVIAKGINFYPGSFERSQVLALQNKIKFEVM